VANGYWHARSIEFFRAHALLEWLRLPGDVLFIAGVVPVVYLTGKAVFRRRPMPEPEPADVESQGSPLFREVVSGNTGGGEAMPAGGLS
jgi:nitric oxide reductase subunit B